MDKLTPEDLESCIPRLQERDQAFAKSLLDNWRTRGLTTNQRHWAGVMWKRAQRIKHDIPDVDLGKLHSLFDTAQQHLKRPALTFAFADQGLKVYRTTSGKYPGAIYVVHEETATWLCRVHTNNEIEINEAEYDGQHDRLLKAIPGFLNALAADPAKVAAEHGHLSGRCCFCNNKLTDERSTSVGYGPVCAKKWGLTWGEQQKEAA